MEQAKVLEKFENLFFRKCNNELKSGKWQGLFITLLKKVVMIQNMLRWREKYNESFFIIKTIHFSIFPFRYHSELATFRKKIVLENGEKM